MKQALYYPIVTKNEQKLPLYISTIGISPNQNHIERPDGIEDYQVLYCVSGAGVAYVNNEYVDMAKDTILFLPPHTTHDYKAQNDDWCTYWITYNGWAAKKMPELNEGVYSIPDEFDFAKKFEDLMKIKHTGVMVRHASALLYEFLLEMSEYIQGDIAGGPRLKRHIARALKYINRNYDSIIVLSELAEECDISEEHFCRIFKEYTGMRPFEYINDVRIKKAKSYLIEHSDASVSDVGIKHGFQSGAYFSQVFKKTEGISPANYRSIYLK